MKIIITTLIVIFGAASATTITVTNNRGPINTREIFDNSGNPLVGGYAAIGVIDEGAVTEVLASPAAIDFVQFGDAAGPIDDLGRITPSITGNVDIDSEEGALFRSRNIYLVVTDSNDYALACELFIYKFDVTFGDVDSEAPISLNLTAADSAGVTLFGVENLTGSAADQYFSTSSFLTPPDLKIPEPSITLLEGLVGFVLFTRRRRVVIS